MRYVELESVLYDLSLAIDPSEWNSSAAKQFALSAIRGIGGLSLYQEKIEYFAVADHRLKFPDGFRVLNQSQVYYPSIANAVFTNEQLLERIQRRIDHPSPELFLEGSYGYNNLGPYGETVNGVMNTYTNRWKSIYKSMNAFCSSCDIHNHSKCVPEYKQGQDSFTFSFRTGIVCLSYKAFAEKDGEFLLADVESLKEAIRYYILYRIYDSKCRAEQTNFNVNERDRCMKLYSSYKVKAVGDINQQNLDLGTMELLRIGNNKMIRSDEFGKGFSSLGQPNQSSLF